MFSLMNVRKLDASIYTISMDGLKYKLAHKRVGINRWSLTENAQRAAKTYQLGQEYELKPNYNAIVTYLGFQDLVRNMN
jgi:hypothetical protein